MLTNQTTSPAFNSPWWARGPHLQTLWGALFRRTPLPQGHTERWDTPDGDFVDVFRVMAPPTAPRVLLLHGLEGTPGSHYARGMLQRAARAGWGADMLVFRGCGAEPNRTPRFYHSGETGDLQFMVNRVVSQFPSAPLVAVGYSLGGNVLLKWLGEPSAHHAENLCAAAAVSVPYDLEAGAAYLGHGFSRVYERHFLSTLKAKAAAKLLRFPGSYDGNAAAAARTIIEFDNAVTAPLHGFASAHAYYTASSAQQFLPQIRIPTLLLSAYDDPFLPAAALQRAKVVAATNPFLTTAFSAHGGHVGFVTGPNPARPTYYSEECITRFFTRMLGPAVLAPPPGNS